MAAAGGLEPDEIALTLVALAHGCALHQLALPDAAGPDVVRRAARTLFIGHLVEQGRVEEAVALAEVEQA